MAMIRGRQRLSLPASSTNYLVAELAKLSRSGHRGRHWLSRTAITFRPSKQGRDAIPDQLIPLAGFKLLAIHYGWAEGRRGPRPSITLGIYRASFDALAEVPIRFRAEEVHDLVRARSLTEPRRNVTAIRSALLLNQAVEDGDRDDFVAGLDWPRFFYGFEAGREPEFGVGAEGAARASERGIDGLRAWPAELFTGPGVKLLRKFAPSRVFASLAHLKGRSIRNPAFGLLKGHGLLPRFEEYRRWLGSVSVMKDGVRLVQDPGSDRTESGRLRRLIESHMVADRRREERMLGELESDCLAMGLRMGEGSDCLGWLAELLDNPWTPAMVGYAARVQRVQLASPTTRTLGNDVSEIELERETRLIDRHPGRSAGLIRTGS